MCSCRALQSMTGWHPTPTEGSTWAWRHGQLPISRSSQRELQHMLSHGALGRNQTVLATNL